MRETLSPPGSQARLPRAQRPRILPAMAVGLSALALGGCGSSQPTRASGPAPAAKAAAPETAARSPRGRCATADLRLSYAGTQGAPGHLELTLSLRNISSRACTLRGYPQARLLSPAGHKLAIRVQHGGGFFPDAQSRPRVVALGPGTRAAYGLSFVTNNEYAGSRTCRTVGSLMSRAPGASSWTRLALQAYGRPRLQPCGSSAVLSPVRATG